MPILLQIKLLKKKMLSVRQTENFVKIFKKKNKSAINYKNSNIKALEQSISEKIGLNVIFKTIKRIKAL